MEDSAVADKAKGDAEFSAAFTSDDIAPRESVAEAPTVAIVVEPVAAKAAEQAKPMSFKETFAALRKAGAKTFEWNGKKYTTELASPKKAPVPVASKPVPAPAVAQAAAPVPSAPVVKTLAPAVEGERKPLPLPTNGHAIVDVSKQTGLGSLKL